MKRLQSVFAILFLLVLCVPQAFGRAGGGASVGRTSSPSVSRPSFSAPSAPRYAAPAAPSYSNRNSNNQGAPEPINSGGGGGGFGSSFVGGMAGAVVGNALSNHPTSTTVVAAPGYAAAPAGAAGIPGASPYVNGGGAPVFVENRANNTGAWLLFIAFLMTATLIAIGVWHYIRNRRQSVAEFAAAEYQPPAIDPLHFFYRVQQASMVGDLVALQALCTPGLADVLAASPEPDRNAVATLKNVQWHYVHEDCIEYRFTDTMADTTRVTERWWFTSDSTDRLEGIQVL